MVFINNKNSFFGLLKLRYICRRNQEYKRSDEYKRTKKVFLLTESYPMYFLSFGQAVRLCCLIR